MGSGRGEGGDLRGVVVEGIEHFRILNSFVNANQLSGNGGEIKFVEGSVGDTQFTVDMADQHVVDLSGIIFSNMSDIRDRIIINDTGADDLITGSIYVDKIFSEGGSDTIWAEETAMTRSSQVSAEAMTFCMEMPATIRFKSTVPAISSTVERARIS